MRHTILVLVLFLASIPARGFAHDYWLTLEPRFPDPTDTCTLRLWVGDKLVPELERPYQEDITTRYEWISGNDPVDLRRDLADGTTPVLRRAMNGNASALVVMDRDFVDTEGTMADFRRFLEHEEQVELLSRVSGEPGDQPVTRRYARCLKALLTSGIKDETWLHAQPVGQALEIVLYDDPRDLARDAKLRVQVLFRGKPLAGELVRLFVESEGGEVTEHKATTSEHGLVSFRAAQGGLWVLRVAHVRPGEAQADWDTYYGTLSFMVL